MVQKVPLNKAWLQLGNREGQGSAECVAANGEWRHGARRAGKSIYGSLSRLRTAPLTPALMFVRMCGVRDMYHAARTLFYIAVAKVQS